MATRPQGRRGRGGFDDDSGIEDTVVKLYRCATVVKGGRRFSFGALIVVGDRQGRVGFGYGKANEVPPAVDKGIKQARRAMFPVPLRGATIPHRIIGRFGASRVVMVPAAPGTGVIAGAAPRAVLELAGIKDVLTKCYGSTSPKNLVKATINGLKSLRTRAMVEELRGVKLDLPAEPELEELTEERKSRGGAAAPRTGPRPQTPATPPPDAPADTESSPDAAATTATAPETAEPASPPAAEAPPAPEAPAEPTPESSETPSAEEPRNDA